MSKPIDLTGQKFGKLMVVEEAYRKKNVYWKCRCDCGTEVIIRGADLRNGHSVSCGCARIDGAIKTAKKMLSSDPKQASARHVYTNGYKDGDITFERFLIISQEPCHYCGTMPEKSNVYNKYRKKAATTVLGNLDIGNFYYNGLDRIDSSKPHNIDNTVPCCKWCNYAKSTRTLDQFVEWIAQAHKHLFGIASLIDG